MGCKGRDTACLRQRRARKGTGARAAVDEGGTAGGTPERRAGARLPVRSGGTYDGRCGRLSSLLCITSGT